MHIYFQGKCALYLFMYSLQQYNVDCLAGQSPGQGREYCLDLCEFPLYQKSQSFLRTQMDPKARGIKGQSKYDAVFHRH